MNPVLQNLNATQVRQVQYSAALQPNANTINLTITNCSVNSFVQQLIINLNTPYPGMSTGLNISLIDRGNGYNGIINDNYPMTFTTIGTSDIITPGALGSVAQVIVQNGNTIVVDVFQSVEDTEGIGNIYIQLALAASSGLSFGTSFTLSVIFRPEMTYSKRLNTRNQISFNKPYRVLSGPGSYNNNVLGTLMTDVSNFISKSAPDKSNTDVATYGFSAFSTSPYFYFGNNTPNKRWYINFASDNQVTSGIATFSYFNGTGFVPFLSTQISSGCLGPGTYQFAYGGIVIFTPPASWQPTPMINDPYVQYNTIQSGLGTFGYGASNMLRGTSMYWIQCQVGFTGVGLFNISTVVPLIDPQQPLTNRRPLV